MENEVRDDEISFICGFVSLFVSLKGLIASL